MNVVPSSPSDASVKSIAFVDGNVLNRQSLLPELKVDRLVLLDTQQDGVEQISQTLARYQGLESVHVLSHGSDGAIQIGNTALSQINLSQYKDELAAWGKALSGEGDLLFYGCNVAASPDGLNFVEAIGQLTEADVAASNDLTGNSALGGDWDLEVQTGEISQSLAVADYDGALATYWVDGRIGNNTNDGLSTTSAFKTIQAAADVAQAGDIVNIRGGVYRETVNVSQSGAEGAPIVFQAFNNEDVTISGGDLVTNWVRHWDNTWKANVNWNANNNRENNTLFVNGDLKFEAKQFADNDILDINDWGQLKRGGLTQDSITTPDLKGFGTDIWNGAKVRFHSSDWVIETRTIADYDRNAGKITFDTPIGAISQKQDNGFYIYDTIRALDKPGEWFKEADRDLLYYQVESGQNPNNLEIEFKRRGFGFDVRGQD